MKGKKQNIELSVIEYDNKITITFQDGTQETFGYDIADGSEILARMIGRRVLAKLKTQFDRYEAA